MKRICQCQNAEKFIEESSNAKAPTIRLRGKKAAKKDK